MRLVAISVVVAVVIATIGVKAYQISNNTDKLSVTSGGPITIASIVTALNTSLPSSYVFLRRSSAPSSTNVGYEVPAYIGNYLDRQGFTSVPSQDQTSGFLSADYFYGRSDAVCQVSVYTTLSLV